MMIQQLWAVCILDKVPHALAYQEYIEFLRSAMAAGPDQFSISHCFQPFGVALLGRAEVGEGGEFLWSIIKI